MQLISVVIDTVSCDAVAVYCNGILVWPRTDWLAAAPCRGLPAEMFVPDHLGDVRVRRAQVAEPPVAVGLLCTACPSHRDCLNLGRLTRSSGWWGATLLYDGKPVSAKGHWLEQPVERPWNERNRETRSAKITWSDVHEIRRRYAAGGVTERALGVEYGLTVEAINRIVNHRSWKNLPKLSEDDAEAIRTGVAAGVTHRVLAEQYGVGMHAIHVIVGDALKRRPKLSLADEAEIRRRYAVDGVLYVQLAREYGVNKATIGKIIRTGPDAGGRKLRH